MENIAMICRAMGDMNRLLILNMLADGERCGCNLLEGFDITQPTLSHHMKILCESGLVDVRKEGKWSHYSLNHDVLNAFKAYIDALTR